MGRIIDETGNRYGRLTVVRRNPENAYHKGANWICRCECGGERVASGIGLRQGLIKSCGCLVRESRVLRCACGYKGQKTRDWTPDWKCYRCSGGSPLDEPPKMTDEELLQKRAEHWRFYHRTAPTSASHDVMLFLDCMEQLQRERDEALERCKTLRELADAASHEQGLAQRRMMEAQRERDEAIKARDQYMRERDQARLAEERWRESLEALEEAIDDCLPGDDDDAPIDCVERAGDKLRELARERDEARADLARSVAAWESAGMQGRTAHDAMLALAKERDEARAEVERLRETKDYLRTWLSSEELEGLRVKAAEHPLLWEEIHHLKDEVKRLREALEASGEP